jgi:hypothetical protein
MVKRVKIIMKLKLEEKHSSSLKVNGRFSISGTLDSSGTKLSPKNKI